MSAEFADFAKHDEDALFITTDGIAFCEGTIGKRLSGFIETCGVNLGSRMAGLDEYWHQGR